MAGPIGRTGAPDRALTEPGRADRRHGPGSTDPHFRFDAIVAATAEVLRDSRFAGRTDLADIVRVADEEAGALPATDEVHDFLDLLDAAARLED